MGGLALLSHQKKQKTKKTRNLTTKLPRIRDSRFLHTGSRISMQLKLSTAAGALAQARADWSSGERADVVGYFLYRIVNLKKNKTAFCCSAFLTPRRWRV